MDLITEVVNNRYPINTKCKVKIAMIEQKRIALKRKITMAMVTDFKVTTLDDKVIGRIKRSFNPDHDNTAKGCQAALLVNALMGGELAIAYYNGDRDFDCINIINGEEVHVATTGATGTLEPISREELFYKHIAQSTYSAFVNRYMRNFMEEIK